MKHFFGSMAFVSLVVVGGFLGCGGRIVPSQDAVDPAPSASPSAPSARAAATSDGAIVLNGDVRGIALDGTSIYVIDVMGAVSRVSRAGGGTPSFIASAHAGYVYPGGLAADDTYLYWTTLGFGDARGQVVRMPKTGGEVEVLADARPRPSQIAIDDARIYWVEEGSSWTPDGNGAVATIAKSGGAVTELASGQPRPIALVLHDDDVYWANGPTGSLNGTVQRVSKNGGAPTLVVGARNTIGALAVAGDRIYWTESPSSADARVLSAPAVGGVAAESPGSHGTGAALGLAGDKLFFAVRRDPSVALLEMVPAASPTVVRTTEYASAISYFAGQVAVSDGATGFVVDVWFDAATGPRSVIHTTTR
jgi:hypothetical protein